MEANRHRKQSSVEFIKVCKWTPLSVQDEIEIILQEPLSKSHIQVIERLAVDPRMKAVWELLLKRQRSTDRSYLYPARRRAHSRSKDEVQAAALAETFHFAFCTARDKRAASKLDDVELIRKGHLSDAQTLRRVADFFLADISASPGEGFGPFDELKIAADVMTLHRFARLCDSKANLMQDKHDPLTVANTRGDPVARGSQITIAFFLKGLFGNHLNGIAATLTAVALDLARVPSPEISRSVFSRQKAR